MPCLCSHLPTHSITAHPMVTIRISDRQRLIQPYIHNYSWLLFAALALYSAHVASSEDVDGEKLAPQARRSAAALRSRCMQLVGDCLMKAHQGKGTKPSPRSCLRSSPAEGIRGARYRVSRQNRFQEVLTLAWNLILNPQMHWREMLASK